MVEAASLHEAVVAKLEGEKTTLEASLKETSANLQDAVKVAEELSSKKAALASQLEEAARTHAQDMSATKAGLTQDYEAKIQALRIDLAAAVSRADGASSELSALQNAHTKLMDEISDVKEKLVVTAATIGTLTMAKGVRKPALHANARIRP